MSAAAQSGEEEKFFGEKVRPILEANCIKCHGGEAKVRGGLKLTTRAGVMQGGDSGPVIENDPQGKGKLVDAINYRGDSEMPPKKKLPAEQIEILTRWVAMGAPWPAGVDLTPAGVVAAPAGKMSPKPDAEARKFWSFQPVRRPEIPAVKDARWARNPIDRFVLARLEAKGLHPAPEAEPVSLLRRAYYDLIGLPPTPAEVEAYLADPGADRYERLINRLLDSPHYGEKWGRHWLDLVRYAESNSYERDNPKPHVWRYRDYVIRSFNSDKPYDRFIREQLAGDELVAAQPDSGDVDPIIATGFYRLGIWDDEPADKPQHRYDCLDDIVATTGQVFLGLTLDCARCHEHKIDPIPQRDYYRLLAFFHNINHYRNGGPTDEQPILAGEKDRAAFERRVAARDQRREEVAGLIKEMEADFVQLVAGEPALVDEAMRNPRKVIRSEGQRVLGTERYNRYVALRKEEAELTRPDQATDRALCVTEAGPNAPDTFVLARGSAAAPTTKVEPGFPEIFNVPDPRIPAPRPGAKTSGRRSVLADWIASPANPMTARVMANRLFQYHFGRGIVRSPNNFGFQGDKPTHPELLDWLASEFISSGWRMKAMHRLIMTSSAYRMASHGEPATLADARKIDPANDLLWHFDLRRLTAEEVRDSILAVNGTLNLELFGPSIYPKIPAEVLAGQSRPGNGWNTSPPEQAARRSIYIHVKRSLRVPIIESMDVAESDKTCPVRFVTVQPTQALGMLNSAFLNEEADKFAARLRKEAGEDIRSRITLGLKLAFDRQPREAEIARGMKLVADLQSEDHLSTEVAMKYFCLMAYNLNEFVYLD